ncbi:MAG TPA: hypothetical protein VN685_05890 [Rhizomicrobium sp.]|nr:hypothetical protein [Rhizomicrobium sp.]
MPNNDTHIGAVGNHIGIAAASFTRPANTNAYAVGALIANSTSAGSVAPLVLSAARDWDFTGMIRRARLKVNDAAWLNATVRVHCYKTAPSAANGDGGQWSSSESEYLGALDVTFDKQFTDPVVKGFGVPNTGSEINFAPQSNTLSIYCLLEARTAVTPAASSNWTLTLEVIQN